MSAPNSRVTSVVGGKKHLGCCKCNRLLPIDSFYTIRGGQPHSWCKPCYRDWRAARRDFENTQRRMHRPSRARQVEPSSVETIVAELADFLRLPAANTAAFTGLPLLHGGMPCQA